MKEEHKTVAGMLLQHLAQMVYEMGGRVVVINGDGEDMVLTYDTVFEVHDKSERPCINDK